MAERRTPFCDQFSEWRSGCRPYLGILPIGQLFKMRDRDSRGELLRKRQNMTVWVYALH